MAEIKSFPNNSSTYVGAGPLMKWLHGLTSGVYPDAGNAMVSAVQGAMAVTVADGIGWIRNSKGDGIAWWNDSEEVSGSPLRLTVGQAHSTLKRIDRVVVSWPTTNYAALPQIIVLQGTASSSPVPPALTNNNVLRQISLAQISIPAGTTSLSPSMVTDERLDRSVCGYVTFAANVDTGELERMMDSLREELNAIHSGSGFELKSLVYSNISVTTSMVVTTTDADIAHPYTLRIPVSGATASHYPEVLFSDAQAMSGNWGGFAKAIAGYVLVGANAVPSSGFTIPAVVLRRY